MIQPGSQELTGAESLSLVPPKDLWETPWSSEDGGGIPSHPDWSRPNRTLPDVFQSLPHQILKEILENKLHLIFLAHIDLQNPDPPFDEKTIDTFRSFITSFLEEHSCVADWTIRPHQPMTLNIMSQLGFLMNDPDIDLFPSLIAGVSTGFNKDI